MRQGVRRVVPLTFGWEHLPKSYSVYGADESVRLREPVPGILLEVDGGWMLLDSGFNDPLQRDPQFRRRMQRNAPEIWSELPEGSGDCVEQAFAVVGIDPGDVVVVALSHLHSDHAGGLRHFVEQAPVHCQRRELEYGLSDHPGPEEYGMFRIDFDDPIIDWRLADGETELADGIVAVPSYGHTPGHQSFMVSLAPDLAESVGVPGFVFAFDAADLQENIDREISPGGFVDCTPEDAVESIRRLKAIAAERGYRLVPGHDPVVWPAFTEELSSLH